MKIGLQLVWFDWGGAAQMASTLKRIAQTAEAVGFDTLWTMDHLFQMEFAGKAEDPMLEAYTTLGFLAGVTERVQLGAMVTGVIYRHPGLLVKAMTTLDVLSGGRGILGIGAAWYEREAHGLGIPFPPLATRFEQLEETLRIAKQMWQGERGAFHGQHYQLAETIAEPQPVRRPHPPILIGGEGEKKTLRLVAQYGDACNFDGGLGEAELKRKLEVLRAHCDTLGTDYDRINKTLMFPWGVGQDDASAIVGFCERVAALGFNHVLFNRRDLHTIAPIEWLGREVVEKVASF